MDQGLPGPLAQPDSEPAAAPAAPAPALALPAPIQQPATKACLARRVPWASMWQPCRGSWHRRSSHQVILMMRMRMRMRRAKGRPQKPRRSNHQQRHHPASMSRRPRKGLLQPSPRQVPLPACPSLAPRKDHPWCMGTPRCMLARTSIALWGA